MPRLLFHYSRCEQKHLWPFVAMGYLTCHTPITILGHCWGKFGGNRREGAQSGSSGWKCFRCGGIGHMMKDCPSPDENQTKWSHHAAHSTFLASAILCESSYDKHVIMDSGATSHMTYNKDWLTNFKVVNPPEVVVLGNGHRVFAHGIGTLAVKL